MHTVKGGQIAAEQAANAQARSPSSTIDPRPPASSRPAQARRIKPSACLGGQDPDPFVLKSISHEAAMITPLANSSALLVRPSAWRMTIVSVRPTSPTCAWLVSFKA